MPPTTPKPKEKSKPEIPIANAANPKAVPTTLRQQKRSREVGPTFSNLQSETSKLPIGFILSYQEPPNAAVKPITKIAMENAHGAAPGFHSGTACAIGLLKTLHLKHTRVKQSRVKGKEKVLTRKQHQHISEWQWREVG